MTNHGVSVMLEYQSPIQTVIVNYPEEISILLVVTSKNPSFKEEISLLMDGNLPTPEVTSHQSKPVPNQHKLSV